MKEISNKKIIGLCLGDFARGLIAGIITTYLLTFFMPPEADSTMPTFLPLIFGVSAISVIRAIGVVVDAVTDPIVANWSDNLKNKNGKRIPLMKWSAIPYALTCLLVFFPPMNSPSAVNVIWVGIMLIAYYWFSTMYNIPFMALQAEIISDTKRRVFLYTMQSLMYVLGSALVFTTGMLIDVFTKAGLAEIVAYRIPFAIFTILGGILAMIPSFVIAEKDYVVSSKATYMPILKSLKATFKYKNFTIMTLGYIIMWVAFTLFNTALMYYIVTLLSLARSYSTIVLGISIIIGVATYPLLNKLVKKTGKKPLLLSACATYVVIYLAIYFYKAVVAAIGGEAFGILIGVCIAFPIAITNIIPASTYADLAQYDKILTGENKTGMFVAARNFINKLSQALVMMVIPSIFAMGSSDGTTVTAEGVQLSALIAAIFVATALVVYSFYNDKEIVKTIDDFNKANSVPEEVLKEELDERIEEEINDELNNPSL